MQNVAVAVDNGTWKGAKHEFFDDALRDFLRKKSDGKESLD